MSDGAITSEGIFAHSNGIPGPNAERVMPLFSLKGKTAIVTGAGAGIGLAVAQALAEAGANVAIWYKTNNEATKRAVEIEKDYGVKCNYIYHSKNFLKTVY
jgi:sorbose reductase